MSFFRRLFHRRDRDVLPRPGKPDQAVIVYLNGTSLPDSVYEEYDLATLEDRLKAAVARQNLGEFDGDEMGPTETALFLYGPDAEALFAGVERTLRDYPLCQGARVVLRRGGPGAGQREIVL